MKRHCENGQKVAEFLEKSDKVEWVRYCGLKSDKYYELGQKYLPNGSCGVLSFALKGDRKTAETFMPELRPGLRLELPNLGIKCFIDSVTHTWTASEGGSTSIQVNSIMNDDGRAGF